jgi:hypothetical protein
MNNLIQKEEELVEEEEQTIEGIPICAANLSSPVTEIGRQDIKLNAD